MTGLEKKSQPVYIYFTCGKNRKKKQHNLYNFENVYCPSEGSSFHDKWIF